MRSNLYEIAETLGARVGDAAPKGSQFFLTLYPGTGFNAKKAWFTNRADANAAHARLVESARTPSQVGPVGEISSEI